MARVVCIWFIQKRSTKRHKQIKRTNFDCKNVLENGIFYGLFSFYVLRNFAMIFMSDTVIYKWNVFVNLYCFGYCNRIWKSPQTTQFLVLGRRSKKTSNYIYHILPFTAIDIWDNTFCLSYAFLITEYIPCTCIKIYPANGQAPIKYNASCVLIDSIFLIWFALASTCINIFSFIFNICVDAIVLIYTPPGICASGLISSVTVHITRSKIVISWSNVPLFNNGLLGGFKFSSSKHI